MPELHLQFEYKFPARAVHDWWTDLSGTGYIGKALKSIRPISNAAMAGDTMVTAMFWKRVEAF